MNFEHYSWLAAIPITLLLLGTLFLINSRTRRHLVREFASNRLVKDLLASYSPGRRKFKNGLLLIALALIIFALAQPQWGFTWRETKSKGIDIMFVVDVSRSMLAQDIKPNRLARSKLAILDFLDKLEGDRVGLVAFAGNAFLQCPLTLDYDAFRQSLEAVDTNVISLGGTDIARAIEESQAAFSDENNYKIMVLITDGEDLEESGIERAREAAKNKVTIYTVGVGTAEGELIPVTNRYGQLEYLRDDNGQMIRTKLDADTLNEIAEATNGFYTPLGSTGYGLEQVYEAGLEAVPEHELASRMQKVWIERFQWPLAIAVILLAWEPLIGTRRITLRRKKNKFLSAVSTPSRIATKAALFILLGGLFFAGSDLAASVRDGEQLFRNGDYAQAAEVFRAAAEADPLNAQASFNLGNALQALGKTEEAQAAYMRALQTTDFELQADAFYNMGNLRFTEAQSKMAETDLSAIAQQSDEASRQNTLAIQQGRSVLQDAKNLLLDQKPQEGQPSAEQMLMQRAQQALQLAEQAKTNGDEAIKAGVAAEALGKPVSQAWEQAAKDFQSSLELNPAGEDAAYNYNYVSQETKDLKRNLHDLQRSQAQIKDNTAPLEEVIEELKKLLEQQQQDQQNQQDQQQQDQQKQDQQQDQKQDQQQQQGQQQQDQQSQQGQQGSESSPEPQNKQQQQSSGQQDQQQGQKDQQQSGEQSPEQKSDQQNQETGEKEKFAEQKADEKQAQDTEQKSGDGEKKDDNQEKKPGEENNDDAENSEPQEGDKQAGEAAEKRAEEVDKMIDAMNQGEPQSEEDTTAPEQGEEKKGAGEKQSMTLSEEDAEKAAAEAAQAGAVQAMDGEPPANAVPLGVMTRDDARRLLESLKRSEKKLPVSGYGRRESNRDDEGKRKDW